MNSSNNQRSEPTGSSRLKSRWPIDDDTSIDVAAWYFVLCGTGALAGALITAAIAVLDPSKIAVLGSKPMTVMLMLAAGLLWSFSGHALLHRRRTGGWGALASFAIPVVQWSFGTPVRKGELLVVLLGVALILACWRKLDRESRLK